MTAAGITRRAALAASLAGGLATAQSPPPRITGEALPVADPDETIDLWPAGPPGRPAVLPREQVTERSSDPARPDRAVTGIATPRLAVFRPTTPNGAALLVMPGGGYARVVVDKEGYEIARWLAARGWTVFVLFYRLPGEGWANRADAPLADAQRAMRLIRARAAAYRIDPVTVGAMGFSAGGHLCSDLATRHRAQVYPAQDEADRLLARPAFVAPIYGVQSMLPALAHPGSRALLLGPKPAEALARAHSPAANLGSGSPPMFLVHAEDDRTVDVANSLELRAACKAAGVPVDLHMFAVGGHGFGLRGTVGKPVAAWPDLFVTWALARGIG